MRFGVNINYEILFILTRPGPLSHQPGPKSDFKIHSCRSISLIKSAIAMLNAHLINYV